MSHAGDALPTPCASHIFKPPIFLPFHAVADIYNKLLRYRAGREPGTFLLAPDLAERWEALDETTYVFHLRQGVQWHQKPPVNGRELVAEDVQFTFDRFLTEKANPLRYMLEPVARTEVVARK